MKKLLFLGSILLVAAGCNATQQTSQIQNAPASQTTISTQTGQQPSATIPGWKLFTGKRCDNKTFTFQYPAGLVVDSSYSEEFKSNIIIIFNPTPFGDSNQEFKSDFLPRIEIDCDFTNTIGTVIGHRMVLGSDTTILRSSEKGSITYYANFAINGTAYTVDFAVLANQSEKIYSDEFNKFLDNLSIDDSVSSNNALLTYNVSDSPDTNCPKYSFQYPQGAQVSVQNPSTTMAFMSITNINNNGNTIGIDVICENADNKKVGDLIAHYISGGDKIVGHQKVSGNDATLTFEAQDPQNAGNIYSAYFVINNSFFTIQTANRGNAIIPAAFVDFLTHFRVGQ